MKRGNLILTVLAALMLTLVFVDILLMVGNQSLQASVSERQQYISETIQLESLNRQVIGVLAELALKTNDGQLKELLTSVGVNLSPEPARAAPSK